MAEKPEAMLKLFADEDPKVTGYKPAYRDYLESVALLMLNPNNYKSIKANYLTKVAQNGKVKGWNYDRFNSWVRASNKSGKEKIQLYELEILNN